MAFNLGLKSKTAEASFSISRDALARYIKAVKGIIPQKTTVPILKFVRIYYKNGDGYMRVSDTECFADLSLQGIRGNGEIDLAVEYTALESMLAKAPRSSGIFLVEREGNNLTFKDNTLVCGKFAGVNGQDCPSYLVANKPTDVQVAIGDKAKYVSKYIAPLCIEDEQYTALNRVLLEVDGDAFGFAATDRHALIYTLPFIEEPKHRYALPTKAFKAVALYDADCTLCVDANTYMFYNDLFVVYGKNQGGGYPDFHKLVFRDGFDHEHKVNVKTLRDELNRLSGILPHYKEFCPVMLTYDSEYLGVKPVPEDYKFDNGGVKMDSIKLLELMKRFDDNSSVTFKSAGNINRPTVWADGKAVTLFAPMR